MNIIISFILAAMVAITTGFVMNKDDGSLRGGNGFGSQSCIASTTARVLIGHQTSVQVLATSSRRAWARIQQPNIATNTVNVNFKNGTAADTTSGLILHSISGVATNTVTHVDFGLNTDHPYTGAITAITNVGSSSVFVTECVYPR